MIDWNKVFNRKIGELAISHSPELDRYFWEAMLILLGIAVIVGLFVFIHHCHRRESDAIAEEIEADCEKKGKHPDE